MPVSEAEHEAMRVKTMVVSVALQLLVGRLVGSSVLARGDVVALREAALKLASDLGASTNNPELRAHMQFETERWWTATEAHACDSTNTKAAWQDQRAP